jgi:hypothetical protein
VEHLTLVSEVKTTIEQLEAPIKTSRNDVEIPKFLPKRVIEI